MEKADRKRRWHPLKLIAWLILCGLVIAAISEGTFRLLGNDTLGRIVCTVALIAVAPFLLRPLIYREPEAEVQEKDLTGGSPADKAGQAGSD